MKNSSISVLTLIICLVSSNLIAQIGGNQLYKNNSNGYSSNNYGRNPVETTSIITSDSTLIVNSKVLMNQRADHYILTVGVNQFGKTVLESNQALTVRIDNVLKKIKKLGIENDDVYVDFISETKQYDHLITDREINEYFDGISIRKNILIKVDDLSKIDKIINYCAEEEIHDIIKVDYVSKDLELINEQLLAEALKISDKKKDAFLANSSSQLTGKHRLTTEKFKVYYPKNLYRQYDEAFETSLAESHYSGNYSKKEERKEKTFYYDGIETESGVDKIIDAISPVIGIQYVVEIQVVYKLKD